MAPTIRPNKIFLPDIASALTIGDSDLGKSLRKSVQYAKKFWTDRFDPRDPRTGYPDTSDWPLYDGHTRGTSSDWPPSAPVVLGSSLAYLAVKNLSARTRGHRYPFNFARNGTLRPIFPPLDSS
ncbi:hypothetical protein N7454_003566 [Penicillium verhagenii]|nr:hypothetical protein N7454_003566 [Penicillium verhagenii]